MKRFILTIIVCTIIPFILLATVYLWADPFKCLHQFDVNDISATNREYLSTELFLRNEPTYHYNSFIFSSSRGGGINTYHWNTYLPEGSQQFLFQAWRESLTGIELKIQYLYDHDIPIDNALILFDIPSSFLLSNQLPTDALTMKHYLFTGQSKFTYNTIQFFNFIHMPSLWRKSIKNKLGNIHEECHDTISNDWERTNYMNYTEMPKQDSLSACSELTRQSFLTKIKDLEKKIQVSEPLITTQYEEQLRHIKSLLDASKCDYHIILSPTYCYTNPEVNPQDLALLEDIFGMQRVHNYTGKNPLTEDYNNFADPGHFGLRVGYLIIEDIYKY